MMALPAWYQHCPQGRGVALMYWGNRDKSHETFQGVWTRSVDKCLRSTDGNYTYCGQGDDMLEVSGPYVSPFEVEAFLAATPCCDRTCRDRCSRC